MKIYKANRFLTFILAILFSFSILACVPIGTLASETGSPGSPEIPDPSIIYYADHYTTTVDGIDHSYNGEPIYITEDKAIELNGVTIEGTDTDPSPITVEPGFTLNIILSGENTLTAKSGKNSAGIYVKQDATDPNNIKNATLNIFAKNNENEGNKLTVTGGNFGAAIGGVGTGNHVSPYNQGTPGIINICSGTILAQGGSDSAGIGAGARASANEINIYGGDITALAGSSGAGIGAGYATSGTSTLGVQVGDFTGGIINITGGTIRAAAGKFKLKDDGITYYSFDDFNIYNTEYFFENCYESNGFGGGIGGGYGAASGTITIGGNADVTAIGSCGGAGIGTGRGSSKPDQYSTGCQPVNITIEGNAKVVAASPDDTRNNQGGGAAIGGGRGFGDCIYKTYDSGSNKRKIELDESGNPILKDSQPSGLGSIAIKDNANITTVASPYAASIGGSWMVFSMVDRDLSDPTLIAKPDTLQIDLTTTISAVSDDFVPAISIPEEQTIPSLVSLRFTDEFFTNNSDVLDNEEIVKFPLKIEAQDSENHANKTTFAINKSTASCLVNLSGPNYRLKVLGENNEENIYLSNSIEDNSATFFKSKDTYEITGLTSPIEQETTIKNGEEDLKIKVKGDAGIFEYGSTFHSNGVNNQAEIDELNAQLDDEYKNKLERVHYYDIGVTHRKAENEGETPAEYETFTGGPVTISVQIPAGWDKDELLSLYVKTDSNDDETFNHRIETIDGVDYITYETTHFSKYAIFDPDTHVDPVFPPTGDNINALIMAILSLIFKSFSSMFMVYCQR